MIEFSRLPDVDAVMLMLLLLLLLLLLRCVLLRRASLRCLVERGPCWSALLLLGRAKDVFEVLCCFCCCCGCGGGGGSFSFSSLHRRRHQHHLMHDLSWLEAARREAEDNLHASLVDEVVAGGDYTDTEAETERERRGQLRCQGRIDPLPFLGVHPPRSVWD
ncbi:hypothetical protein IWX47DRAFT_872544 [Phyllosticta citricarpa]|uniref:Uncharacterized protein n=1 Tax=Phyllosticta citricarpa TaxID=55181 RepID=A0ABR1M2H1_9PEZI